MRQDKEVTAEDVTVVMRQVSLMGTVKERPPGSGGRIIVLWSWIFVPGGFSEDQIIVPGSWIIVPARSYRGEEKEFRRKPLAMSLREGPAVHS